MRIGTTYTLQKEYLKKLNLDEVFEDTWQNQAIEWIIYVKNDV